MLMTLDEIRAAIATKPRFRIGFYPTPFHKVANISARYGVDIYLKREDLAGPSAISGSKIRMAEFIIGEAKRQSATHIITVGAYLSNSAMQIASAAICAGITPIVFLYDHLRDGGEPAWRGNLLIDKIMDIEVHCLAWPHDVPREQIWDDLLYPAVSARQSELERQGHKVVVAPAGAAHPSSYAAHLLTYAEIMDQSRSIGVELDYLYHSTGTGGVLPGFVAGRMLTEGAAPIRSIAVSACRPDNFIHEGIIIDRVRAIFESLGQPVPENSAISAELNIDQRFYGPEYAIPSDESTAAIKELAASDAVLLGPVYTAKGFAGLLNHIREGRIPRGSSVMFLHTGDVSNLFEDPRTTGPLGSI